MADLTEAAVGGASSPVHPFLNRELRVELKDGRVVVGTMLAFQGSGDLLLRNVVEQRRLKDKDFVSLRRLNLLAIPFQHVVSIQRRKESAMNAPIYAIGLPTEADGCLAS